MLTTSSANVKPLTRHVWHCVCAEALSSRMCVSPALSPFIATSPTLARRLSVGLGTSRSPYESYSSQHVS